MPRAMIHICCFCFFILIASCQAFTPPHRGIARLFLDTADISDWDNWLPTGMFHGVTTNPTILERDHQPCTVDNLHMLAEIALKYPNIQEFMCQTWGETIDEMVATGMALSKPDRSKIVVKVPVTKNGVEAATQLIHSGCRVCLTACYHHKQAIVAASIGAEYLAPYAGRMSDEGRDGPAECAEMKRIVDTFGSDTRILVASLRDANVLSQLASSGLDTFTFSAAVAKELFDEPLTDKAAAVFEESARKNTVVHVDY